MGCGALEEKKQRLLDRQEALFEDEERLANELGDGSRIISCVVDASCVSGQACVRRDDLEIVELRRRFEARQRG